MREPTDQQIAKLPAYARRLIEHLQRRVSDLEREQGELRQATYGAEAGSPVVLADYVRGDVNLPRDARIRFYFGERPGDYAEAWMVQRSSGERVVEVRTGWSALVFQPQSGNSGVIRTATD